MYIFCVVLIYKRRRIMQAEMTEIVMPGDANHFGICFGGKIMSWIDMVAAITAQKFAGDVVTASVDSIEFIHPIAIGDIVTLKASVNCWWKTSMEIGVKVQTSHLSPSEADGYSYLELPNQVCRAYLTFIAVSKSGMRRPIKTHIDQRYGSRRRRKEANIRRELRLKLRREKING
jgi:acyl-CoA hydrolase